MTKHDDDTEGQEWWKYNGESWTWEPVGVGLIIMGLLVMALGFYMMVKIR